MLGNLIFVSYRRADSAPHALALALEIESRFRAAQAEHNNIRNELVALGFAPDSNGLDRVARTALK